MQRRLGALVAGAMLLVAQPAAAEEEAAEEPSSSGLRFGVRSGYAFPAGSAFATSGALSDTITGYLPVRFDVGARIADHFYVGALFQYGIISPANCPSETECSGSDVRFGAMAAYHLLPRGVVDPWIGVGMGYEIMNVTRTTSATELKLTARGLELIDGEIGVDFRPTSHLRVGPVLSGSLARFSSIELNGTATRDFEASLHGWVMLGVRGTYDL